MQNIKQKDSADNRTLNAALRYAERGWHVFPVWSRHGDECGCGDHACKNQGKHPIADLAPNGFKSATTDELKIRRWWKKYPDAGIGIVTGKVSNLLVIDLDQKKERDGLVALSALHEKLGALPDTKTAVTASGGSHFYFQYVDDIRCSSDKLGVGLDVKSDLGYVVAPPSHGLYRWIDKGSTEKLPKAWIEHLSALQAPAGTTTANANPEADPELVAKALAVIPNDSTVGWEDWNKIAMATFRATGGSEDGYKAFDEWSQKWREYDADNTRKKWQALVHSPPTEIGAGSLFFLADHACPGWRYGPEISARLAELATLDRISYDQTREQTAKGLGIRVGTLDREVESRRTELEEHEVTAHFLQPVEPWPKTVSGDDLLNELCEVIERHIVVSGAKVVAIGLWVLHSHAHDAARHSPIIYINSPTKRCGKTNLLELLSRLVPKPLSAANVTPATVFRAIQHWHPTMLIDEMDTFLSDKSELRGVLNSGHTKSQAFVLRCVGDDLIPTQFSTWAPKAFASIGRLHPTLEDRSIPIELKRKLPSEKVQRIPKEEEAYTDLQRKCARWALDHMGELRTAKPKLPVLNDRARDNWEPLLAIADCCGPEWGEEAREVAVKLSGKDDDETYGIVLLKDLRRLFKQNQCEELGFGLSSTEVVRLLEAMENRPWPEFKHGKPITTRGVAALLKPFKVHPKQIKGRDGNWRTNGYMPEQFVWAFKRYLPQATPKISSEPMKGEQQQRAKVR